MSSWIEVYTRCMDGEYFRGAYCPRDGHSNDLSIAVSNAVDSLREQGILPSFEELRRHGILDLRDVVIVRVESPDFAPDWFWLSDR